MTRVLLVILAVFLLFELLYLPRDVYTAAEKLRLLRFGIFFGYLSAVIVGCGFYWDSKATRIIDRSITEMNNATWHIKLLNDAGEASHQAQIKCEQERIEHCQQEIQMAAEYQKSKSWLNYLALLGIVVSVTLQLLGSTGTH